MPLERLPVINMPFLGGQDEGVSAGLLDVGGFVKITNGQFAKNGRINKRDGTQSLISSGASSIARLGTASDQLLGFNQTTGGSMLAAHVAGAAWKSGEGASPWTVRREQVFRDMSQTLQEVDVAVANGYRCAVWRKNDDNVCHLIITEIATRTIVFNADVSAANARSPRIAKSLSTNTILATWVYGAGASINHLKCVKIDCTVNPPTVSAETDLVADVDVTSTPDNYDLTGLSAGRWAISYRQDVTLDLEINEITSVPAVGLGFIQAGTVLRSALLQIGTRLWVAYYDSVATTLRYLIRDAVTWGALLGPTDIQAGISSVFNIGLTANTDGVNAIVVWTRLSPGAGSVGSTMWWAQISTAGAVTGVRSHYRLSAESKPFTDLAAYWIWVRQGSDTQAAYALVELPAGGSLLGRPTVTAGIGQTPTAFTANLRWTALEAGGSYHTAVPAALTAGGTRQGADELIWSTSNAARWQHASFGGADYFSGGVVSMWDGLRLTENGVVQPPQMTAAASGVAGLLKSAATYTYCQVYEWIDAKGQRTRSLRSALVTVTTGGAAIDPANKSVDITFAPLTLTLRQQTSTPLYRVVSRIYRSQANASPSPTGEIVLNALHTVDAIPATFDNNPFATVDVAFNDGIADGTISAQEIIYTAGGALDHDTPWGGAAYLWRFGPRLWACDGENGEIVWFSEEEVAGEPAQFNLGLQIRVAGDHIIAGAPLDSLNVLFSTSNIYGISGAGPNDTGNPQTGSFTTPEPIVTDAGCIAARSLIEMPLGLMFQSRRGLMLLDRSRNVKYLGRPVQDTLAAFPTVLASCLLARRGQVMWLVTSGEAQRLLVYDYVYDRWSVRTYPWLLTDIIVYNDRLVLQRSNGIAYQEVPGVFTDDGAWFGQTIETGAYSFGGPQSFKRLWRVIVLTERKSAHGLTIEFAYDAEAFKTSPTYTAADTITLTAAETLAMGDQLRIHMKHQKGEAWRLRLTETDPGAGAGEGFVGIGLGFEVGSLPGVQRLPAAASR